MDRYFLIFAMFLNWKNADLQIEPICADKDMVLSNVAPIIFFAGNSRSNSFHTQGKCRKVGYFKSNNNSSVLSGFHFNLFLFIQCAISKRQSSI